MITILLGLAVIVVAVLIIAKVTKRSRSAHDEILDDPEDFE